ncbi:MAG: secondary thiamine-phosphate synthase enzyme YjbQ [Syntrophomonas sp.]
MLHKVPIRTTKHEQMIDITNQIQSIIKHNEIAEGTALVYCPHTTAAITINENADPDVVHDMLKTLDKVYPWNSQDYRHAEGNSAAHLKASTIGCSQCIPITNGNLLLGTWQGIYFCEFDGPRQRSFYVKLQKD